MGIFSDALKMHTQKLLKQALFSSQFSLFEVSSMPLKNKEANCS